MQVFPVARMSPLVLGLTILLLAMPVSFFGTFGWLWSRKAGRLDVYVTNLGPWVVVTRRASRPVVLSPADPDAFAAALADRG